MKPIIEVNHVWKEYQKGIDRKYKSLRDTLLDMPSKLFGAEKEKFWALEDIDFKVEAGESLGIIGRNGAGKSTLLKILSRITPPTKGEIILRGRIASLLEVGTGFHPELTGRENVFFNGSILGMKHTEIKRKYDEIVAFSGVESFIDTPMKHYSSGMQMRLAFSVAAHLDSEILLIDEVLAVGDAEFQKKCIGKMDDVSKGEGKTILFVSHDMNALSNLTSRGMLIQDGTVFLDSHIQNSIKKYIEVNTQNVETEIRNAPRYGNGVVKILKIKIHSSKENSSFIYSLEDIEISVTLENNTAEKIKDLKLDIGINNTSGRRVAWLTSHDYQESPKSNEIFMHFRITDIPLVPGDYNLNLYCEVNNNVADWLKNISSFKILNSDLHNPKMKIPENQGDIILKYETLC